MHPVNEFNGVVMGCFSEDVTAVLDVEVAQDDAGANEQKSIEEELSLQSGQ